jgi:hypothetical protein
LALPAVLVLVAACGAATPRTGSRPSASTGAAESSSSAVLHLQDAAAITTLGGSGGRWTASGAVAAPDWSMVFTVEHGRLRTLDGATGAERGSRPVAAGLLPVVSSSDGSFVALTDTASRLGQGAWPAGRSRSRVVVAPAGAGRGDVRSLVLEGNVLPEAFSTDGAQLFVIEFLPALHPDRYRVRALDIATGRMGPVFTFDKSIDTEEMRGLSRTQVFTAVGPYGPMLYTLYTRADRSNVYADVHALALNGGFVHCTDLPAGLRITPAGGAITVSPNGQRVYVAGAEGAVAEIDASVSSREPFPIVRTTQVPTAPPGRGSRTVALAADDGTIWVGLGTRLVGLGSNDLHVVTSTTVDLPIDALAVRPGGGLYAATSRSVQLIEAPSGVARTVAAIDTAPVRLAAA